MREGRQLLLMTLCMAFACLLLTGASRLIATEPEEAVAHVHHQAYLCSAGPSETETNRPVRREAFDEERTAQPGNTAQLRRCTAVAVRCDANGNVLGHRSYLHTVYLAFAPGDGFA